MNLRIRVFPAIVSVATLLAMLPALPAQAADVDPGFLNPDASGDIDALALQPDGKLLVGGGFDEIGGQIRNRAARLNAKPSEVAIAWLLTRSTIAAPIASASNPDQLQSLIRAASLKLDDEALKALEVASAE